MACGHCKRDRSTHWSAATTHFPSMQRIGKLAGQTDWEGQLFKLLVQEWSGQRRGAVVGQAATTGQSVTKAAQEPSGQSTAAACGQDTRVGQDWAEVMQVPSKQRVSLAPHELGTGHERKLAAHDPSLHSTSLVGHDGIDAQSNVFWTQLPSGQRTCERLQAGAAEH